MSRLMSTKEVATFLGINEKKVYGLITESGLPATKATGKWLFPSHLVEQWVESRTVNVPIMAGAATADPHLLVVAGSNDLLLDKALALYMRVHPNRVAVFGNLGSLGGLKALRRGLCHIATSHLAQQDGEEFNFAYAASELEHQPAIVNFCRREQGLLVAPGNPLGITSVADIPGMDLRLANRPLGTGTRLLLDRSLALAGADVSGIKGYDRELSRHLDVGLEVLAGRADVGPAIRCVADILGLGFVSLAWERYDLLIPKDRYFDKQVQLFLDLLASKEFVAMAGEMPGYDVASSGKVVFCKGGE
ncbi:MAG: substrate-binding domain-containing protein [Desulfovibrionaceae bacterium]